MERKTGQSGRFFALRNRSTLSEIPVRCSSCFVHGVLGGLFGVADGLLALALDFLHRAFALELVGADGFADALLGLADGFVGGAFNLV
jgi:hypothetical protein